MKNILELLKDESAKLEESIGQRASKIENLDEKLVGMLDLITNKHGFSRRKLASLFEEAEGTSDFPVLFGTILQRTLLAKYQIAKPDWRAYVKTGTVNDFRIAQKIALYGLRAPMPVVSQGGEYKAQKLSDGKFSVSVQKFGSTFQLGWEALINDDLGAFQDCANDLSIAALRLEQQQATALFVGTGGPNSTLFSASGTHPIDGTTFANLDTKVLSADNLAKTITKMKQQKDADGMPIIISRFHVVTPVNKEFALKQILSKELLIASVLGTSANNLVQGSTSENIIASYPITAHTNEFLDTNFDATNGQYAWYVFADPATDGAAVELDFLRGHESPEIVQRQSLKVSLGGAPVSPLEGDFESDSATWRVRHVLGGTQLDPRFAYAQNATS